MESLIFIVFTKKSMMKKISLKISLLLLVVTSILSCNNNRDYSVSEMSLDMPEIAVADAKYSAADEATSESASPLAASDIADRMLIKNGELEFETDDIQSAYQSLMQIVKENKGYIVEDKIYDYSHRKEHRIAFKIPVNKFDASFQQISDNAPSLKRREINIQDVTEEFVDLETRISNKKTLEKRYNDLLAKANKIEDMLQIEKSINEIRTEIETLEGRKKYIQNNVSYSTINVTIYTNSQISIAGESHWIKAFKSGWKGIVAFALFVVRLWPFIILLIIGVIIFKRVRKNKRAKL